MLLPQFAIKNHQFTLVIVFLLVFMGLFSFLNMPRLEDPQVKFPAANVIAVYPGATPADIEELIIDPVEEALNELDDIKRMGSTAMDGVAITAIEFSFGTDPDDKYEEVLRQINSIRADLPDGIIDLDVMNYSPSEVIILQLAFESETASYLQLRKTAESLEKDFEKVFGVKGVDLYAVPTDQVKISLHPDKLELLNLSPLHVFNALQAANVNIPGGILESEEKAFNVLTTGSMETLEDINQVVVKGSAGGIVRVRDIADVEYGHEDIRYFARHNGKRSVFLTVKQKEGTNIFSVTDNLMAQLEAFKSRVPEGITVSTVFQQSNSVETRVNGFIANMVQGIVLVGLVIFALVGVRASLIVMIAIPISILTGLAVMDANNYALEQMSITGLVIALGLLVDNAIVVVENINRFIKLGYNRVEAAIKGTSEIAWPIISSTVTTILAFVPMIMMQNDTGQFIKSMPMIVVFTLVASLFVALSLTPFLSSRILKEGEANKLNFLSRQLQNIVTGPYQRTLNSVLKRPKTTLILAFSALVISLALFPLVGVSFFPKAEKPAFIVNIDMPKGTHIESTNKVSRWAEEQLMKVEMVQSVAANIGHGNPRFYYNVIPQNFNATHAQLLVQVHPDSTDRIPGLVPQLRKKFDGVPGATIVVKELEQGPPFEAPIAIRIIGDNLETLKDLALQVEEIVRQQEGSVNVDNPLGTSKTDIHIRVNHDKAGRYGVLPLDIDRSVRAAIGGLNAGFLRDSDGDKYELTLRLPFDEQRPTLSDLDRITVPSQNGRMIPLDQVADIEFKASEMEITHYKMERSVSITGDVEAGFLVGNVVGNIVEDIHSLVEFPPGYRFEIGGEVESQQESFSGMLQAIMVAMIAIFAVLVLQFRSYVQPVIVFTAIPLAFIGSVLALLFTGYSFSFTAFIGVTSLVGIVINNSIILVDYTNQLVRAGQAVREAVAEAAQVRFAPIVFTTLTTIGGLLPLTLQGGTLWAPLGWTIIGGLGVSTFLTTLVVPALYMMVTKKLEN